MKAPDVKIHFIISLTKSLIRLVFCFLAIINSSVSTLALGLIFAELLGALEEIF